MSAREAWLALAARVDQLPHPDRIMDAAMEVQVVLAEMARDPGTIVRGVRVSQTDPGLVVRSYTSGSTGTAQAPRYTGSIDAIVHLVGERVTTCEWGRHADGTFWCELDGITSGPQGNPCLELAHASAACRVMAELA